MWLHTSHGCEVSELAPLKTSSNAQRGGGPGAVNLAKAFVAETGSEAAEEAAQLLGVPCKVVGPDLVVEAEQGPLRVTALFMAEVSCYRFSTLFSNEIAVIAVVPPAGGDGIKGTAASDLESEGGTGGWFIVCAGVPNADRITLDALSRVGCLREDLEESFAPHNGGSGNQKIGEGAYSTVQCMQQVHGSGYVAVKQMNQSEDLEPIQREIATLIEVQQHANILGFRGLFFRKHAEAVNLSIVCDLMPCGDLFFKVSRFGPTTEANARQIFSGTISGLGHIHSHGIVHRDIKADNILLNNDNHAVVADFGLATWVSDKVQMARRCGSPGYVAPEVCLGAPYSYKVDMFGVGVVLYFILSKDMPFSSSDQDTATTMRRTVKCSLHLHRPPWDSMTNRLRNVLRQLICKDQADRLSAEAAFVHPWTTNTKAPAPGATRREPAASAEQPGSAEGNPEGGTYAGGAPKSVPYAGN